MLSVDIERSLSQEVAAVMFILSGARSVMTKMSCEGIEGVENSGG